MLNVFGNEMMPFEDCVYIGDKVLSSFEVGEIEFEEENYPTIYTFPDTPEGIRYYRVDSGATCQVISTNTEHAYFGIRAIAIDVRRGEIKLVTDQYNEEGEFSVKVSTNISIVGSIVVIVEGGSPEYLVEHEGIHYYTIKLIEKPIQMLDEASRWKFPMIAKFSPGLVTMPPSDSNKELYAHGGLDIILCVPARGERLLTVISFSKYSMYTNMIEKAYQYFDTIAASLANYSGIRVGTLVKLCDYNCFQFVKQGKELTSTFICRILSIGNNFMNLHLESDIRHDFSQKNILIPISISDFFTFCATIYDENTCILTPTHKIFQKNSMTVVLPVTGKESKLIEESMDGYMLKPKLKKYLHKDFGFSTKEERTVNVFNVRDNNEVLSWQTKFYPDIEESQTD